jgi:predicted RNase H-like nuclease (RuvC/YqgF family)
MAKSGGFQFVDASDRKTIVRLRNTMVSRKHRDNKVQRIKELERMLEERDREIEELRRAVRRQDSETQTVGKGKGRGR